jgi:ABC-2 type transport system ATP-binding protein
MPPPCIKLEGLTKHYGSSTAVANLSLEVRRGEILGLLGPNGAGKSTTLSMISGLVRPSAGSVSIFGRDAAQHRLELAPRIGVLTENPSFYDHLTVAKNLTLLAHLSSRELTVDRALGMVNLLAYADRRVGTLSRGLRQRLGLAQAFLTEPELLLLDEPTTALDADQSAQTIEHLQQLARQASVTILLSTHEMEVVESLCDRVAVLELGHLILCENTDNVLTYDRTQVDVLLDAPEAAAKKLADESWAADLEVRRGRLRVRLLDTSPGHLASFLTGAGYSVNGIVPRRRSVQELYIKAKNQ